MKAAVGTMLAQRECGGNAWRIGSDRFVLQRGRLVRSATPPSQRWADSEQITLDNLLDLDDEELEDLYSELRRRRP